MTDAFHHDPQYASYE